MSEPQAPETEAGGLILRVSEANRRLEAVFVPAAGRTLENAAEIRRHMEAAGFGDWYVIDHALNEFVGMARKASAQVSREIAEQRDAEIQINVSRDELQATLTLTPAWGGKTASRADVAAALEARNVVFGIDWAAVDAALAKGQAEGVVVARGEPAQDGRDARFALLLKEGGGRRPKIDERGVADYRDLNSFLTVEPGQALMRRVPATPGRPGQNVHGLVIAAKPGKDTPFSGPLKGASLAHGDPNLLVADCGGLPTVLPDSVRVDPVITVDGIDLSTGNLEFDGVVNVKGDVASGLRIRASGDIFVNGTVEGAELETPGSIEVKGAVIGQRNLHSEAGAGGHTLARIRCGGCLRARVVTNALVEAGDSVFVTSEIVNSEVSAKQQVVVGQGAAKGQLVGGETRASLLIQAPQLGSGGGAPTKLYVGLEPGTLRALRRLETLIDQKTQQREELSKGLAHLLRQGEREAARQQKVRAVLATLVTELEDLEAEAVELRAQLAIIEEARIVATREAHVNVELNIAGATLLLRERTGPRSFALREDKIVAV